MKDSSLNGTQARRIELDEWVAQERRDDPVFREAWDEARNATAIARNLAERRKRLGLSQRELAHRLGTSQQAVSRMEHPGYPGNTLRMLARYAEAVGARIEFRLVDQA